MIDSAWFHRPNRRRFRGRRPDLWIRSIWLPRCCPWAGHRSGHSNSSGFPLCLHQRSDTFWIIMSSWLSIWCIMFQFQYAANLEALAFPDVPVIEKVIRRSLYKFWFIASRSVTRSDLNSVKSCFGKMFQPSVPTGRPNVVQYTNEVVATLFLLFHTPTLLLSTSFLELSLFGLISTCFSKCKVPNNRFWLYHIWLRKKFEHEFRELA